MKTFDDSNAVGRRDILVTLACILNYKVEFRKSGKPFGEKYAWWKKSMHSVSRFSQTFFQFSLTTRFVCYFLSLFFLQSLLFCFFLRDVFQRSELSEKTIFLKCGMLLKFFKRLIVKVSLTDRPEFECQKFTLVVPH